MLISQVPVNRGCWVTFSANIQPTDHTSTGVEYFKPSRSSDHQTKQEFDPQLQSISPSIFLIPHSDHHSCWEGEERISKRKSEYQKRKRLVQERSNRSFSLTRLSPSWWSEKPAKLAGLEGKQIEDSNMYTGYIGSTQSSIKVVYHLESQSKDLQWWYEFATSHCSLYLLRVIGKYQSSFVGKELLFTEVVEGTLHDWVKKNLLVDFEYPERPSKPFIGILGCTLRQPHGEICANNVYLVNGNAKLGKALNPEWYKKTFGDDIDKFCGMVKSLFKSEGSKLPFGLDHLHLMNAINHPIKLTPDARCEYRLEWCLTRE
ncbi:unnamed protein product [Camellia sinensis]